MTDITDMSADPPDVSAPPKGPGLTGATLGMAIGTTLSRLTGVARIMALTYVLGTGGAADAYNLANTTPNIITDVVIGGVLAATFVPVFVDRLSTRRGDEAWRAISAVTTAALAVLALATVLFWFLTPSIIHLYTSTNHSSDRMAQQRVAIELLRWFVPQLACYGLIGLASALLNSRRKFAAPMFVPIANNLVVIVVLFWFHSLVPHPSLAAIQHQQHALILLGLGTTAGVLLQAVLLLPSLLRTRMHLSLRWEPTHEAVRAIVRLASWTFGFVVANQVALVVILALADGVKPTGAVSAYTYAYTFFQLPYGVVAVSLMSAITPSLAAHWALRDTAGFRRRLSSGLRAMLAIVIPSAVGMLVLAHPLIDIVLAHGTTTPHDASSTAAALAMLAIGLPGFCVFLYMVRVLQAMQDSRTAFFLYLLENSVNIVAGLALVGPLGVRGLALSVSLAYSVAAIISVKVVGSRIGGIGGSALTGPLRRVTAATLVMAVVTVLTVNVSSADRGVALLTRVFLSLVSGTIAYVVTAGVIGARQNHSAHGRSSSAGVGGGHSRSDEQQRPRDADRRPPAPFHGRLVADSDRPRVRLLRPVASDPAGDEEDVHGSDPDYHR